MDGVQEAESSHVVRQGFLCPFCMEDCGEYDRLIVHVEVVHPEEDSSDLAGMFVSNVKGLFDKAKRGIQKLDAKKSIADIASSVESEFTETTERLVVKGPLPRLPKPLPPDVILAGIKRSRTREFLTTRELNINEVAVRTNMLIIRLDRLIHGGPKDKDPAKRKEFEREIVPWLDDAEAVCCPLCAVRFGITRRRHHCRLCGRVLCHSCSKFLAFDTARTLTSASNPLGDAHMQGETIVHDQDINHATSPEENGRRSFFSLSHKSMDKMKRAMAGAVQKVHSAATGEEVLDLTEQEMSEHMRVCSACLRDLQFRESQMENKDPPPFVKQYEQMQKLIDEVKNLTPTYVRVVTSLQNGESVYTHKHGEELRSKCLELQKSIDLLSKKIAEGADEKQNAFKEQQLRRNIRVSAVQHLQGMVGKMESLPSAEECAQRIVRRKEKRVKDFARVNRTVMKMSSSMPQLMDHRHLNSTSSISSLGAGGLLSIEDGWTADENDLVFEPENFEDDTIQTDHPLYEQREQLRKFLYQAASTGKLDEMDILERSLKELEEEMRRLGLPC